MEKTSIRATKNSTWLAWYQSYGVIKEHRKRTDPDELEEFLVRRGAFARENPGQGELMGSRAHGHEIACLGGLGSDELVIKVSWVYMIMTYGLKKLV